MYSPPGERNTDGNSFSKQRSSRMLSRRRWSIKTELPVVSGRKSERTLVVKRQVRWAIWLTENLGPDDDQRPGARAERSLKKVGMPRISYSGALSRELYELLNGLNIAHNIRAVALPDA